MNTEERGNISGLFGAESRSIMLIAVAIFLVGSIVYAPAPKMNALIVGRAIQGLGGSGMGIMVNIIVSDMFSLRDRGLYLAITSLAWAVGSAIGPVLGGVFERKKKKQNREAKASDTPYQITAKLTVS
jgi:MFS family permease